MLAVAVESNRIVKRAVDEPRMRRVPALVLIATELQLAVPVIGISSSFVSSCGRDGEVTMVEQQIVLAFSARVLESMSEAEFTSTTRTKKCESGIT